MSGLHVGRIVLSESVPLCLSWAAAVSLWLWATWRGGHGAARFAKDSWRRLNRDGLFVALRREEGASYALPIVMTIPLYLVFCLFVAEITLMLSTKVGTVYAAYAGARSAAVWDWLDEDRRDDRMRQSVVSALAPFTASGHERGGSAGKPAWDVTAHIDNYIDALESYSGSSVPQESMRVHWERVAARTSLELSIPERRRGGDISVRVTYRAPILFAGVAVFLDPDHRFPYELPITTTVKLTLERPVTPTGTMGIDYHAY
ncbi:MAG: hypothetical protein H7062_13860 [Candidatus Saccharimonas sp.]|nr:hypothetical protein [Planctomycetaceae bacterium]